MPIQGSIAEAGLPDVLQLLSLGRKTGCLSMADGPTHGDIYLADGRVSFASVANRLDRLGEVLVKSGRITRDQLKVATEEQSRGSKQQIGKILVDAGHIERTELERWVKLQVEESVYFLFTWKQGTFTFTSDRRPPTEGLPTPLEAEGLLLEGARRVDEWSQIEKKIPSFDLVYRRSREKLGQTAAGELTYPQQRILPLLDGTRDVNGLVDATGLSEFDVGKALYGLVTAGIAQLVERRAHIRHLDYRELLAYVVREAEFADAQRRKDAGRHIVDCPQCSSRLRTIQVRRTEGSGMFAPATLDTDAFAEEAPPRPQLQPHRPSARASGVEVLRLNERRVTDRRSGEDRRRVERRSGGDRRHTINAAWGDAHEERRYGPRRASDRTARPRGRRSGDIERRSVAAGGSARPMGPGQRLTEPRQVRPLQLRGTDQPFRVAATLDEENGAEQRQVVSAEDEGAVPEAEAAVQDRGTTGSQTPDRRRNPSPITGTPGQQGAGLDWLVTPEESVEMIRASRASRRADAVAPPAPAAAAAPKPPPAAVRPPEAARPPEPVRPAREALAAESYGADRDGGWTANSFGPPRPYVGRDRFPVRQFVAAAGVFGIVLVAYLVGQRGSRGVGRDQQAAENPAAAQGARAEVPAPAAARGSGGVRSEAKPAQTAARSTPAPARGAAAPPAGRGAAPAPSAPPRTQALAQQRAAPQPSPQPVVSAPSATQPPAAAASQQAAPAPAAAAPAPPPVPVATKTEAAPPPAAPHADVTPTRLPAATEPDRDLAAGGWAPVDRAGAATTLGGTLGAIEGLAIETITQSTAGPRTRVRVAQLTAAGERIVLTETRAGAAVRGAGPAVVTALRVMPASEAYPFSTGTVSLGNILITAKSGLQADTLRSLLAKLGDLAPGR